MNTGDELRRVRVCCDVSGTRLSTIDFLLAPSREGVGLSGTADKSVGGGQRGQLTAVMGSPLDQLDRTECS